MSKKDRITIDADSLLRGAATAGVLARAMEECGSRLTAIPLPPGTPADVAAQLAVVRRGLHHEGASLVRQRGWLQARAELASLADGPLAKLVDLLSPPLPMPVLGPSLAELQRRLPGPRILPLPGGRSRPASPSRPGMREGPERGVHPGGRDREGTPRGRPAFGPDAPRIPRERPAGAPRNPTETGPYGPVPLPQAPRFVNAAMAAAAGDGRPWHGMQDAGVVDLGSVIAGPETGGARRVGKIGTFHGGSGHGG